MPRPPLQRPVEHHTADVPIPARNEIKVIRTARVLLRRPPSLSSGTPYLGPFFVLWQRGPHVGIKDEKGLPKTVRIENVIPYQCDRDLHPPVEQPPAIAHDHAYYRGSLNDYDVVRTEEEL